MSFKQLFRFWFDFTPAERRGTLFLFVALILLLIGQLYIHDILSVVAPQSSVDFSPFEEKIDSFISQNTPPPANKIIVADSVSHVDTTPQHASKHYRKPRRITPNATRQKMPFNEIIEINSADTATLKKLRGIGKILSTRIVKYRNRLGGFYSINQLKEVYGLRPKTFKIIQPFLHCDTSMITKININKVSFKQLLRHPYLNYQQVKSIFRYKDKHHTIKNLQELEPLLGKSYKKIIPYLTTKN